MSINHFLGEQLFGELFHHHLVKADGYIFASERQLQAYRALLQEQSRERTTLKYLRRKFLVDKAQTLLRQSNVPEADEELKAILFELNLKFSEDGFLVAVPEKVRAKRYVGPSYGTLTLWERQDEARRQSQKAQRKSLKVLDSWMKQISSGGSPRKTPEKDPEQWNQDVRKSRQRKQALINKMAEARHRWVNKSTVEQEKITRRRWIASFKAVIDNIEKFRELCGIKPKKSHKPRVQMIVEAFLKPKNIRHTETEVGDKKVESKEQSVTVDDHKDKSETSIATSSDRDADLQDSAKDKKDESKEPLITEDDNKDQSETAVTTSDHDRDANVQDSAKDKKDKSKEPLVTEDDNKDQSETAVTTSDHDRDADVHDSAKDSESTNSGTSLGEMRSNDCIASEDSDFQKSDDETQIASSAEMASSEISRDDDISAEGENECGTEEDSEAENDESPVLESEIYRGDDISAEGENVCGTEEDSEAENDSSPVLESEKITEHTYSSSLESSSDNVSKSSDPETSRSESVPTKRSSNEIAGNESLLTRIKSDSDDSLKGDDDSFSTASPENDSEQETTSAESLDPSNPSESNSLGSNRNVFTDFEFTDGKPDESAARSESQETTDAESLDPSKPSLSNTSESNPSLPTDSGLPYEEPDESIATTESQETTDAESPDPSKPSQSNSSESNPSLPTDSRLPYEEPDESIATTESQEITDAESLDPLKPSESNSSDSNPRNSLKKSKIRINIRKSDSRED